MKEQRFEKVVVWSNGTSPLWLFSGLISFTVAISLIDKSLFMVLLIGAFFIIGHELNNRFKFRNRKVYWRKIK